MENLVERRIIGLRYRNCIHLLEEVFVSVYRLDSLGRSKKLVKWSED